MKKLYRRSDRPEDMILNLETEIDVTNGQTRNVWFKEAPGWYAVDVKASVANQPDGNLSRGRVQILVDGVVKAELRASWPWTRQYVYCDEGYRNITFRCLEYAKGDTAKIRNQNAQYFREMKSVAAIERCKMPEPLEKMNAIALVNGYSRYQSSGPVGCQIEMTLDVVGTANYRDVMSHLSNYYILKGDEGMYGGVLLTSETETEKAGALYLIKTILHSPSLAGVGH
jgi:hypothetical protein